MIIRALKKKNYPQVKRIYSLGLQTGIASFETAVPSWKKWNKKFLRKCRFVAIKDGEIIGWCALTQVYKREVYKGVVENTIYMDPIYQSQGLGRRLLEHLVAASEAEGFWTLQAAIFPENKSSINLHINCGFTKVGVRKKIAQRDGKWYDNLLLERRSNLI